MAQFCISFIIALIISGTAFSQDFSPNYEEEMVPEYTLPEILKDQNGVKITDADAWRKRRVELFNSFEVEMYGKAPEWTENMEIKELSLNENAFDGKAIQKEIAITVFYENRELVFNVLLFLPKTDTPVPFFVGLNFYGNQSVAVGTEIELARSWVMNNKNIGITDNKASEKSRGVFAYRWPVDLIVSRGYGIATVFCGDFDPDYDDGFKNGTHGLMNELHTDNSWGTIAAWAWGLSRVMDYFETDNAIDNERVAVFGHSRLGKAALWAGAADERFALVISNNSGCGGAALSRRKFGETVARINNHFPHWFAGNFKKYNDNEHLLPFDQHQLLALIAPRPLYVASAEDDQWADPRGEFLSAREASKIYQIYGLEGLPVSQMPRLNQPVSGYIGYHYRSGGHDIAYYDWVQYLNFADNYF
jgi:hypothetical protein